MEEMISNLWTQYMEVCGPFASVDTACREFLASTHVIKMCEVKPQHHAIGNIMGHYLNSRELKSRDMVFTTSDVLKLALLLDSDTDHIIEHLHHLQRLVPVVATFHKDWQEFQRVYIKPSYIFPLTHLKNLVDIVGMVVKRQLSVTHIQPNYNRYLVLLFRIHFALEDESLQPRLRWGKENDWVTGLHRILNQGVSWVALKDFHFDNINDDLIQSHIHFGVSVRSPAIVVYENQSQWNDEKLKC